MTLQATRPPRSEQLGAHAFEPSDDLSRLDKAGRPIRTCRICGRPGRGSGHRFHGLTPSPPALRLVEKTTWNETRPSRSAAPPDPPPTMDPPQLRPIGIVAAAAPTAPVIRPGRHAFRPNSDGRMVQDARGTSWVACEECGKDRRAHPRRSPAQVAQDAAQAPAVAVMAADTRNGSRADPGPSGGVPAAPAKRTSARPLPAAELVAVAVAIDRVLALPIDLVGWRLRFRLADVRKVLNVPEYPTLDVAELREVDPEPPSPAMVATTPELRPRQPDPTPDSSGRALLRGIRSDRIVALARRALDRGGTLSMTGSGHLAIDVGGQRLIVSTTQGGGRGRGWGNTRAAAKRAGIDVTGL